MQYTTPQQVDLDFTQFYHFDEQSTRDVRYAGLQEHMTSYRLGEIDLNMLLTCAKLLLEPSEYELFVMNIEI